MTSTSDPLLPSQPVPPILASGAPARLSWGALFGALFVTLGVFALLTSAGMAVGLSVLNVERTDSARAVAAGIAIWSGISSLVALFIGGMTASRTAAIVDRVTGAIHGAVLWGLKISALGFVMFIGSTVGSMAAAAAGATGDMPGSEAMVTLHAARAAATMWWVCISLTLGLASAVLGALVGVTRRKRRVAAVLLHERAVFEAPAHA